MIELGPGADLLRGIGTFFWLLVLGALAAALLKPRTWIGKLIATSIVIGLFVAYPGRWAWERKKEVDAYHAALAKAEAVFHERCKTAGEKIYKTVDNVEGVLLMKLRTDSRFHYQDLEDPFGANGNSWGEDYITSFLAGRVQDGKISWQWFDSVNAFVKPGYAYVDAVDPKDGRRYRYSGAIRAVRKKDTTAPAIQAEMQRDPNYDLNMYRFVVDKVPATGPEPRYGVIFEDLTTPEERAQWVAGGSFKVIDLKTREVLAERIGYLMDRGLGSTATARTPWRHAVRWSCPDFYVENKKKINWDREFSEQVLKIKGN